MIQRTRHKRTTKKKRKKKKENADVAGTHRRPTDINGVTSSRLFRAGSRRKPNEGLRTSR
ncbi:hypothetical protein HanPI659440_Chr09g0332321 [Helianthus annuus]|nr:hypothetical protein HanPI659440_Chr09g0332321 [Helianthus annuus]